MDDAELARIEKDMRKKLATPRYPPIFYLPQAYEVQTLDPIHAPPKGIARCTSVARSERDLGGNRGGMGGVVREPVSCALEAGHGGPHKTRSFPIPTSKMQAHWEWSDSTPIESGGNGVPEDAARMGAAAIASFSGRVFDGNNEGLPWTDSSSRPPFAELWSRAGFRFRAAVIGSATGFVAGMILMELFLNGPRWPLIVACVVALTIATFALGQASQAARSYQRRLKAKDGQTPVSDSLPPN